jgi:hypothetical protein
MQKLVTTINHALHNPYESKTHISKHVLGNDTSE